jgi:UDP-GlcNAc:undecaprenyl-phosphate GlcNAc-1-phosphate transferase
MSKLYILVTIVIAMITAYATTPAVRRLALQVGMLDETGERRMHDIPKPRIGGIAVWLGFAFALFSIAGFAIARHQLRDLDSIHNILGILFGATLILVVGIWDDVMTMSPRNKFGLQIVVASISMLYGFIIQGVDLPFTHDSYIAFPLYVSIPVTLIWYLGMMNAINFIDGLDGLLSGLTVIAGSSILVIAYQHGHTSETLILAALIGGALGFLPHNFNPAKIILGDSGALFIGYVFATTSIIGVSKTAISVSLLLPVIALALPILDTAVTIVRRTRAGKKITEADRGHFHHQLIFRFGLNVKQAVFLIYALCIVLGVTALLLSNGIGGTHFARPL